MRQLQSKYIIQKTEKSHCPNCHAYVDLMMELDSYGNPRMSPMFYICWHCKLIAQVGKGEVKREPEA